MTATMTIDEIQLVEAHFSRTFVKSGSDDDPTEGGAVELELICGNSYSEESHELLVTLEVICEAPNFPFKIQVKYGGKFSFSEAPTKDELDRFANVLCPFQLFPYIREYVSELTRKGGFEPLYLPPVNFIEMHKKRNEKQPDIDQ